MKKRDTRMCSRKKRFRDLAEAKKSVGNIFRNTGDKLRYYKCPNCSGYHLSSKGVNIFSGESYVRKEIKKRK